MRLQGLSWQSHRGPRTFRSAPNLRDGTIAAYSPPHTYTKDRAFHAHDSEESRFALAELRRTGSFPQRKKWDWAGSAGIYFGPAFLLCYTLSVCISRFSRNFYGTRDIRTTMNIYPHAVPAALRKANSKVVRLEFCQRR
jgi:hypothetical protein